MKNLICVVENVFNYTQISCVNYLWLAIGRQGDTFISIGRQIFILQSIIQHFKGKACPVQAWTGPQGCGRLRLAQFQTVAS